MKMSLPRFNNSLHFNPKRKQAASDDKLKRLKRNDEELRLPQVPSSSNAVSSTRYSTQDWRQFTAIPSIFLSQPQRSTSGRGKSSWFARDKSKIAHRNSAAHASTSQRQSTRRSYLTVRKEQEKFREYLLQLLKPNSRRIGLSENSHPSNPAELTEVEKDTLRYYYYIHRGIAAEQIPAMQKSWIENILNFITPSLQLGMSIQISQMVKDVEEEYLFHIKKATVDMALHNPYYHPPSAPSVQGSNLLPVPTPWRHNILAAKKAFTTQHSHLFSTYLYTLLSLWEREFSAFSILDFAELDNRDLAHDLFDFRELIQMQVDSASQRLLQRWHLAVHDNLQKGIRSGHISSSHHVSRFSTFLNCVDVFLTLRLQSACLLALHACRELFTTDKGLKFRIVLIVSQDHLELEPSLEEYETVVLGVFDKIVNAVTHIPSIHSMLIATSESAKFLCPTILPELLHGLQNDAVEFLRSQWLRPSAHISCFNKYSFLLTGQAQKEQEDFISSGPKFEELTDRLNRHQSLANELRYSPGRVVQLGMMELSCTPLLETLIDHVQVMWDKLLACMIQSFQAQVKGHLLNWYRKNSFLF